MSGVILILAVLVGVFVMMKTEESHNGFVAALAGGGAAALTVLFLNLIGVLL